MAANQVGTGDSSLKSPVAEIRALNHPKADPSNGEEHFKHKKFEEVKLFQNGKAIGSDNACNGTYMFVLEQNVNLEPGINRFTIFARNGTAHFTSEERVVIYTSESSDEAIINVEPPRDLVHVPAAPVFEE